MRQAVIPCHGGRGGRLATPRPARMASSPRLGAQERDDGGA